MRRESERPKRLRDGTTGWIHRLSEPLPPMPPVEDEPADVDAAELAESMFRHREAARKRVEVASQLGVTVESLERLRVGVGWDRDTCREFSSWPAVDALERVVGITRRYGGGKKMTVRGTRNSGVYVATRWWECGGPVLVVEGGSDVAAMVSAGIVAIGRPSCVGGAEVVAGLWRRAVEAGANLDELLVVAERDWRQREGHEQCDGCRECWPGWAGACCVADSLRRYRGMLVRVVVPPVGCKDVREVYARQEVSSWLSSVS